MGRTRAYDESKVLQDAAQAFRRNGYETVSVRDLEAATGLKAGSIYNSFGSKEALFNAVFEHYNSVVLGYRIKRYAPPDSGVRGLLALFRSLLHEPNGESFGCLITNSAIEFGGAKGSHPAVEEGLRILTDTFAQRLSEERRSGRLHRRTNHALTASKLLALYQGVLVLVRAGHDKAVLEKMLIAEFKELEEQHDT